QYTGDTTYAGSTSAAVSQVVNQAATSTALASSANPTALGQSVTFTAMVGGGTVADRAGETATFKDGSNALGSGTLDGAGHAIFTTTTLAAGNHSISASYGGDTNYSGSISPTLTELVKLSSSTALTSSANPSVYGQSITLTATVTGSAGTA